jgi:hypothetical protein
LDEWRGTILIEVDVRLTSESTRSKPKDPAEAGSWMADRIERRITGLGTGGIDVSDVRYAGTK